MSVPSEYEQIYDYWKAQYNSWITDADRVAIAQLTDKMMPFDLAYGQGGQRAAAASHFAWLVSPPETRDTMSPLLAHLILWLYGIDGILDTCDAMDPAYDLHRLSIYAANHPHDVLTDKLFDRLLLRTDPASLYPKASCTILTLGSGIQSLMHDIRNTYPNNESEIAVFLDEFDFEVWAEATEALWRIETSWHGRSDAEYIRIGAASIASIVATALCFVAVPSSATLWPQLRAAVWQASIVCRLANDIATLERDREEHRANAVFIAARDEPQAITKVQAMIVAALNCLPHELAPFTNNPNYKTFDFVITRMAVVTMMMYHNGVDFIVPLL